MENEPNYLERPIRLNDDQIEALLIDLGAHRTKHQGNNIQAGHCFLHHNHSPTLGVHKDFPHSWNCYTKDTEVLTRCGWKSIAEVCSSLEDVVQYDPYGDSLEWASPSYPLIKPNQHPIRVSCEKYTLDVTSDHRCLAYYRKHKGDHTLSFREVRASEVSASHWMRTAANLKSGRLDIEDDCIRLAAAIQADGSYTKEGTVAFGFSKMRKIMRLALLLTRTDSQWRQSEDGTTFKLYRCAALEQAEKLLLNKQWALDKLLALSKHQRSVLIDEVWLWDGHTDKAGKPRYYCSGIEANARAVQTLLSLSSVQASCVWNADAQCWYVAPAKSRDSRGATSFSVTNLPRQDVFCFSVPSTWLLVRCGGRIVVSGNCFSCHKKGPDIVSLVERAKKCDRQTAYAFIVQKYEITLESAKFSLQRRIANEKERQRFVLTKAALAAYPLDVNNDQGYRAAKYYLGIDKPMADAFRLGYRALDHRLVFPVFHADGELGGLIGRSMLTNCKKDDRWRNFDAERFKREYVLMGAELPILPGTPILVVEGPHDFFALRALGVQNVRSTLGSDASDWQIELLASYEEDIVPLYDADHAGEDGRRKLRRALRGKSHVLGYKFPEAAIDPDSGKGDPAMLNKETLAELIGSFRRGFNFASMSTRPSTPR